MKRTKTILYGATALIALLFVSKRAKAPKNSQPDEYQANDDYLPDSLAIHHWLS
jgi:hypothetical protein